MTQHNDDEMVPNPIASFSVPQVPAWMAPMLAQFGDDFVRVWRAAGALCAGNTPAADAAFQEIEGDSDRTRAALRVAVMDFAVLALDVFGERAEDYFNARIYTQQEPDSTEI